MTNLINEMILTDEDVRHSVFYDGIGEIPLSEKISLVNQMSKGGYEDFIFTIKNYNYKIDFETDHENWNYNLDVMYIRLLDTNDKKSYKFEFYYDPKYEANVADFKFSEINE